jgi:uncharacterized protein
MPDSAQFAIAHDQPACQVASPMTQPDDADLLARIDQLWIYPVKSCAGIALPAVELTPTGLRWDRHWMVVDAEGGFVSQRELPRMALIQPGLAEGGLVLTAPGMPPLRVAHGATGPALTVRVWDDQLDALDMGDAAAQWFSDCLAVGAPEGLARLRLVAFDPSVRRVCSPQWTGGRTAWTQFADGFGVLVTSTASLDELNRRLKQGGHAPVAMNRFRPNVVLSGVEPHDEDRMGLWRVITEAGEAVLDNVKPCARCPIPNIDPMTALTSPAVGDTLQTYRQDRRLGGAVTFGMNAMATAGLGQVLRVGQQVRADWRFD